MSNYLNFSIQSESDIMDWVLMQLGYPLIQVEIHESQLRMCINDALEEFTKYVIQEREYLALDLETYATSGFTLPDRVTSVFALEESDLAGNTGGINTLFSVQNNLWNAGAYPQLFYGGGRSCGGGSWVDYELALQFLDLTKKMTAGALYFEYNERTKVLTLIPNPSSNDMKGWICIGCNTIRDDDYNFGESWVKRYTLACAKVVIGNIRSKYEGTLLLGGGTVSTAIKDEGLSEKTELLEELRSTYTLMTFFVG